MLSAFETALHELTVIERIELKAREKRILPVPDSYHTGPVAQWLMQDDALKGDLWRHQALALEAFASGNNVVLSTGTASGKSLVFQAAAIKTLQQDHDAKILVLYPQKALASDQHLGWRRVFRMAGIPEAWIASITGDVLRHERAPILEQARVIIATPDVCQAWLTRELANPSIKIFLKHLELVIVDEAHVFEAVFGSNAAFLFRRLQSAARICRATKSHDTNFSVIAASATIANPAAHLRALTGLEFSVIDQTQDGSPQHARSLMHLACSIENAQSVVANLQRQLVESSNMGSFITFVDSRQGAERIAAQVGHDLVKSYRAGYEAEDRSAIEEALQSGRLRGVVSTSALELGIDISHFSVGLNLGLPMSRKAFRQRLGRIGRSAPGAFAVVAESGIFRRYGSSLEDYYNGSVEPSHLYLDNRFLQFAHARCLADELDMLGVKGRSVPPSNIDWPSGFSDICEFARVGGTKARPREFDQIARIGGDNPHQNYPLRNVGEESFQIGQGSGQVNRVGTVTLQQAIREAYPGAIYMHMGQRYRVQEWRSTAFDRIIRVYPWNAPINTRPRIRTYVNASIDRDGLVAGNFLKGEHGFLIECQLQITERVEGYQEQGDWKFYRDLRGHNPHMTPKIRDFRTTGVVLKIEQDWIAEGNIKATIADTLRDFVIRHHSISPQDVGCAATNVALVVEGSNQSVSDAIVVYDATYGSLRLTEPVFTKLGALIGLLEQSSQWAVEDAPVPEQALLALRNWVEGLQAAEPGEVDTGDMSELATDGLLWVLAPGSVVAKRDGQGVLREMEIVCPELLSIEGPPKLFYRYKDDRGRALVPANKVELVGGDYEHHKWNPETGEYVEDENDD